MVTDVAGGRHNGSVTTSAPLQRVLLVAQAPQLASLLLLCAFADWHCSSHDPLLSSLGGSQQLLRACFLMQKSGTTTNHCHSFKSACGLLERRSGGDERGVLSGLGCPNGLTVGAVGDELSLHAAAERPSPPP